MKKKGTIKKGVSNEDLARMVAKGFESMDNNFSGLENKMTGLEDRMTGLEDKVDGFERRVTQKIGNLERRIDDVVMNRATKDEVYALSLRVDNLEIKTGLKEKGK
ncbi:MAG: hypothetical protein AAB428_02055 [Patescibacteria group bacterium]